MKRSALILALSLMNVTAFAETRIHCAGIGPGDLNDHTTYDFSYSKKDGLTMSDYADKDYSTWVNYPSTEVKFWKKGQVKVIGLQFELKYYVKGESKDLITLYRLDRHNAILHYLHGSGKNEHVDKVNMSCD